jgi:hypothetical protein
MHRFNPEWSSYRARRSVYQLEQGHGLGGRHYPVLEFDPDDEPLAEGGAMKHFAYKELLGHEYLDGSSRQMFAIYQESQAALRNFDYGCGVGRADGGQRIQSFHLGRDVGYDARLNAALVANPQTFNTAGKLAQ